MVEFGNRIDQRVRLFRSRESVVRRIDPTWTAFYARLDAEGVLGALSSAELIPDTRRLEQANEEPLLFGQAVVPFVAFPFEWTPGMFRKAADRCLALHAALLERGLCLHDSHAWNVVFRGAAPLWVDITSISPFDGATVHASLRQFVSAFLNPLTLFARGHGPLVRSVLMHSFFEVSEGLLNGLVSGGRAQPRSKAVRALIRFWSAQSMLTAGFRRKLRLRSAFNMGQLESPGGSLSVIKALRRELDSIPVSRVSQEWSQYVQSGQRPISEREWSSRTLDTDRTENAKVRNVITWLKRWRADCTTVLDLACNKGLFAQIACLLGYTSAGIDTDEGAIEAFFEDAVRGRTSAVGVVNDFVAPREALGMATNPLPSLSDRFQADVVILLAAAHHLRCGRYQLGLGQMVALVASFTRRFAIIEFVPRDDEHLMRYYPNAGPGDDYSEEEFRRAVSGRFDIVETEESFPKGRSLWVLRRI